MTATRLVDARFDARPVSIPVFPALVDRPGGAATRKLSVVRWAIAPDGSIALVTCGPATAHRRIYVFDERGDVTRFQYHEEPSCDRVDLEADGRVRLTVGATTAYVADPAGRVDLRAARDRPVRPRDPYVAVYDARGQRSTARADAPAEVETDRYLTRTAAGAVSVWFGPRERIARTGSTAGLCRYDLLAPPAARIAGARFAGGAARPGWFLFVRLRPAGRAWALRLDRSGACTGRIDLGTDRFGPGYEPEAVDAAGRLYAVSLARGFALVRWTPAAPVATPPEN